MKNISLKKKKEKEKLKNKEWLESTEVINTLKQIPDRRYYNMADVEKALGEIR
jgi:Protein of unknown function (DUF2795)